MDRKIVKPAQKDGRIWSPEHRRFLPNEGIEVAMSPYWLHLVDRGDVLADGTPDDREPEAVAPGTPSVPTA